MRTSFLLLLALILAAPAAVAGGRGAVSKAGGVQVFTPRQRALVAWNGKRQILVLSTDMRAEHPTMVLEVLPLPSRPAVFPGRMETLVKTQNRVARLLADPANAGRLFPDVQPGPMPTRRFGFPHPIAPHHPVSVEALDYKKLYNWVVRLLGQRDMQPGQMPAALDQALRSYDKRGFRWYAFHQVDLVAKARTILPTEYHFDTPHLFFPNRISTALAGDTEIELTVITPDVLTRFRDMPMKRITPLHLPLKITPKDLRGIHGKLDELFAGHTRLHLRSWRLRGKLSELGHDLVAR